MHDIKWIRDHAEEFDAALKRRGVTPLAEKILALDEAVRHGKTELQELQQQSNQLAKEIGQKKAAGEEADEVIATSKEVKAKLAALKAEEEEGGAAAELRMLLLEIPNLLDDSVPEGKDEDDNQEIRSWGEKPQFGFQPKEHDELGTALGMMDFEQTAKISGSRFVTLFGELARLERALAQFMLEVHTQEFGYVETSPPLLVRDVAMEGSGQLPKFAEDSYAIEGNPFRLIPTSEVSLVNLAREKIFDQADLPRRYTAYTPCFRSEAGAAGKDTKGMFRQHQFWKVELVSVTDQESAWDELERKTACAEEILKRLGLAHRTVLLCSGDTGFGSHKTYDLEVWMPGQERYREVSSCSNCGAFQARRMQAKYRDSENNIHFVHTLNGSGLAVGRIVVAILENYQNEDGSVTVPEVLRGLMGCEVIK